MTNEQQFVAMQIARGKFCKTFDKLMQSINRVTEKFCMKQIYSMRKHVNLVIVLLSGTDSDVICSYNIEIIF